MHARTEHLMPALNGAEDNGESAAASDFAFMLVAYLLLILTAVLPYVQARITSRINLELPQVAAPATGKVERSPAESISVLERAAGTVLRYRSREYPSGQWDQLYRDARRNRTSRVLLYLDGGARVNTLVGVLQHFRAGGVFSQVDIAYERVDKRDRSQQ